MIGVLGAGISGLSAAYYISKMYGGKVGVVVFEESDRVGGWMRTVPNKVGGFFEMGPRVCVFIFWRLCFGWSFDECFCSRRSDRLG